MVIDGTNFLIMFCTMFRIFRYILEPILAVESKKIMLIYRKYYTYSKKHPCFQ